MNLLQERKKRAEEILQGKFIQRKLEETSKEIDRLQTQEMSDFRSSFWNNSRKQDCTKFRYKSVYNSFGLR